MSKEKTVTVTAPTLADLEAAEQEAMAKVAEARRARDRLQPERENRRAAALEEYDRQVLAGWNEDRRRLEVEAGAAREAFRAALLADPTWSAYRQQVLAQHRLRTRWLEVSGVSARLGRGEFQAAPAIEEPTFEMLARIVAQSAEQEGTAEVAAREAAREDVGQAAADEAGRA